MNTYSRLTLAFLLAILVTLHASGQEQEDRDFLSKESVEKFLNHHLSDKPQWYGLYAHNKKIGYLKTLMRNISDSKSPAIEIRIDGFIRNDEVEFRFTRADLFDNKFPYQSQRILEESFIETNTGKNKTFIELRRTDENQNYAAMLTDAMETRRQSINIDYELTDLLMIDLWCTDRQREIGDTLEFKEFDTSTLKMTLSSTQVTQVKKEVHGGKPVDVVECEVTQEDGASYHEAFLDDGTTIRMFFLSFGIFGDAINARLEDEKTAKIFNEGLVSRKNNFLLFLYLTSGVFILLSLWAYLRLLIAAYRQSVGWLIFCIISVPSFTFPLFLLLFGIYHWRPDTKNPLLVLIIGFLFFFLAIPFLSYITS